MNNFNKELPASVWRVFVSSCWYDVKTPFGKAKELISGDRAEMEWEKHLDELKEKVND